MVRARTATSTILPALLLCTLVGSAHATDLKLAVGNVATATESSGPLWAFWVFGVLTVLGSYRDHLAPQPRQLHRCGSCSR